MAYTVTSWASLEKSKDQDPILAPMSKMHILGVINFFNTPASTYIGPAFFHLKTGCPILPVFDIRVGMFKHKILFGNPIFSPADGTNEEKIAYITQKFSSALEEVVRKYPEQYFWFHKRWKTQPKLKK